MMNVTECIKTRRSYKSFKVDPIGDDVLEELIDCARYAPSAMNKQPWEFIVVKRQETKDALSSIHEWGKFVNAAPVILVVCYNKVKQPCSPHDILSSSLAVENILLAAHEKGIAGRWVHIKNDEAPEYEIQVKHLLQIPDHVGVLCLLPLGYPDGSPSDKNLREINEIVHEENW